VILYVDHLVVSEITRADSMCVCVCVCVGHEATTDTLKGLFLIVCLGKLLGKKNVLLLVGTALPFCKRLNLSSKAGRLC